MTETDTLSSQAQKILNEHEEVIAAWAKSADMFKRAIATALKEAAAN